MVICCIKCGKRYYRSEKLDFLCSCGCMVLSGIRLIPLRITEPLPANKSNKSNKSNKTIKKKKACIASKPRIVEQSSIYLTNKRAYLEHKICPQCGNQTAKEYVSIKSRPSIIGRYLSDCPLIYVNHNLYSCSLCKISFITKEQIDCINNKANKRLLPYQRKRDFLKPENVEIEFYHDRKIYLPESLLDTNKKTMPPLNDVFYDVDETEREFIIGWYLPEKPLGNINLNHNSILSQEGYSTSVSQDFREIILNRCIEKHGKSAVLQVLHFLVSTRSRQKNGETKYAYALLIWNRDIAYVENYNS